MSLVLGVEQRRSEELDDESILKAGKVYKAVKVSSSAEFQWVVLVQQQSFREMRFSAHP